VRRLPLTVVNRGPALRGSTVNAWVQRSPNWAIATIGDWGLEPDALNPCRYRASVGDCIRGTGNVPILLPCRVGAKSQNAGTIEGEEEGLSVWSVVNDDRLPTNFDRALLQRMTAVPKNPSSDAGGTWLI